MYPSRTGRDHLGLGSVSSDQILPTLSPGINVLTFHPRYYSFYTFLLDEFWERDRPRSRRAWVRFYRPRAFIFSVGAYLCDQAEHRGVDSIVGGQKTSPLARKQLDTYDTTFNYIKSRLGGYGLYYRSVIAELGLVFPGGSGLPYPVDVPSERGKQVAGAFRRAVRSTAYYKDYFDKDEADVPIEVIREFIHQACLCQLQVPGTPDRSKLLDVFLHAGAEPEARRATFRLFLDIANQTDGHAIDQDAFRQLLYFGETTSGATYDPLDEITDTHRRWRLYQAREYYAFALNAMWCYLCDWGLAEGGDIRPIPLSHFWDHLDLALDLDALSRRLQVSTPGLSANSDYGSLLDWLRGSIGIAEGGPDASPGLASPVHEHRLYRLAKENRRSPDVMIAGMMAMLALIYVRFGQPDLWLAPEWEISRMGADGRLSVDGFVKSIRRRMESGPVTVGEIARWLFADYIILQHQLIATSKLPDNTFRFRREGDRLRFHNLHNSLVFMNSRFEAISTTLHELGFCEDFGRPDHTLTGEGQTLLEKGDLE